MSKYEFWLSYNNNAERMQLPVLPGELLISQGSQNTSVNIARLGEITIIQDPVLKTFDFSAQFPATYGPYCSYRNIPNPHDAVNTIDRWISTNRPIRFIVTGTPINFAVSVEDFQHRESHGDIGTLYYDISLKEYKFVHPRRIEIKKQVAKVSSTSQRPNEKTQPKTYSVVSGDTLSAIARKVYQDSSKWKSIWETNKDMLIKRDSRNIKQPGHWIYPGQKLVLP